MVFCQNCGTKNEDGSAFCKECGASITRNRSHVKHDEATFEDVLKDFLMIKDVSSERISKAKLIGLLVLLFYILNGIYWSRFSLSFFWGYAFTMLLIYLCGLFYYGLIRGLGYILRKYIIS